MKIKNLISLIIIIATILFIFNSCSSEEVDEEKRQKEMIQATSQISLKDHGYKMETSPFLEDWNINKMTWNDTFRWTVSTYSVNDSKRLKWIFEWTGNDKDDVILIYLLIDGKEIVNDLR